MRARYPSNPETSNATPVTRQSLPDHMLFVTRYAHNLDTTLQVTIDFCRCSYSTTPTQLNLKKFRFYVEGLKTMAWFLEHWHTVVVVMVALVVGLTLIVRHLLELFGKNKKHEGVENLAVPVSLVAIL